MIKGQWHTVEGLGSRILLISFFAFEENHGGNVKSALNICHHIASFKLININSQEYGGL